MKHNITLALDKSLLKKARSLAAQRGANASALLSHELLKIVDRENAYEPAKQRALARLRSPFQFRRPKACGPRIPARPSEPSLTQIIGRWRRPIGVGFGRTVLSAARDSRWLTVTRENSGGKRLIRVDHLGEARNESLTNSNPRRPHHRKPTR